MENLFAERFSELLDQHLWSYEELAKKLGLKSKGTICKYAKGHIKNVSISMVKTIADLYKVSPVWLIGLQDTKTDSYSINENYSLVPSIDSAGIKLTDGIVVPNNLLNSNSYTVFKCEDTSMSPIINPNDLLLVELNNNPKTGDLCLILDSNNFMIRKFVKQHSKTMLSPLNNEFNFTTYSSDNKTLGKINIIGIVKKLERNCF